MSWTDEPGLGGGGRLFRRAASVLFGVVAALVVPLAITAHWAVGTVDDSARYQHVLQPLAGSPPVQRAVTDQVTDQLVAWARSNRVPVSPAVLRPQVRAQVASLVQGSSFPQVWDRAVALSHPVVTATLDGRRGEVGPVSIDLTPLLAPVVTALHQRGITALDGLTGTTHRVTIRVVASNDVSTAQGAFAALQVLEWALPAVAAVAALGALLAAVRRLRTVAGLVAGIAVSTGAFAGVVAAAGVPVGRPTGSAGDAVVAALFRDLRGELLLALAVSAVVAAALIGTNALVERRQRRYRFRRLS